MQKALATVRDADDLPAECEPRRAARDVLTKTSALAEAEASILDTHPADTRVTVSAHYGSVCVGRQLGEG